MRGMNKKSAQQEVVEPVDDVPGVIRSKINFKVPVRIIALGQHPLGSMRRHLLQCKRMGPETNTPENKM